MGESSASGSSLSAPVPDWSNLPQLVVSQIFQELKDPSDRLNASLACKTWNPAFSSPTLWRKLSLNFQHSKTEVKRKLGFARRFGQYVKDVDIRFRRHYRPESLKKLLQLIGILQEKKCKLNSFRLNCFDWWWLSGTIRSRFDQRIINQLTTFLTSQDQLQECSLQDFDTDSREHGLTLLEILSKGKHLRYLDLSDYFFERLAILSSPRYRSVMSSFCNLIELDVSSHDLDRQLLKVLVQNCSRTLKNLGIHYHRQHGEVIPVETWSWIKQRIPEFNVRVTMHLHSPLTEFLHLLSTGIPLNSFSTAVDSYINPRIQMDELLETLRQRYADRLEDLFIDSNKYCGISKDECLFNLVRSCTNLKRLRFKGYHLGLKVIRKICNLKISGTLPQLLECEIKVRRHNGRGKQVIEEMKLDLIPEYRSLGAKLDLGVGKYNTDLEY